jgi:hypothetical protein
MTLPTSIQDLELQGSHNLKRALDREARGAETAPLTQETKDEIAQIDGLIQQCIDACRRGQTVNHKKNPAFDQLAVMVKTRDTLRKGRKPSGKKSVEELMKDADTFLARLSN